MKFFQDAFLGSSSKCYVILFANRFNIVIVNWLHFKPEFSGKPDKDAEAHVFRTNDWMYTHAFPEGVCVQRFHLTLVGETRLWSESLRPIAVY